MAIKGYFGPRAERRTRSTKPKAGPKLPPVYTQAELRDRRRNGLTHVYGSGFSLTVEVADLITAAAAGVAADVNPRAFRDDVERLADAVHELLGTVVGWVAEAEAIAKVTAANVAPDSRARSVRLLKDIAERPPALTITDADLQTGKWATELVEMARPYSDPLSGLLGRAPRPGMVPDGALSLSERLEAALKPVDRAVRELQRQMSWIEYCRTENAKIAATRAGNDPKARARAELAALGIVLTNTSPVEA